MSSKIRAPHNATRHPFTSIVIIALRAILCGMDTCEDFVGIAKAREDWLRKWIDLPNSIPCANTFIRTFAALDPTCLESTIGLRQL